MRRLCLVLLALLLVVPVAAQQDPVTARGFAPEKAYEVSEVDAVNLFNGMVNVTIPIGGAYKVGGSLSYGLTLLYAPSWEMETQDDLEYQGGDSLTSATYAWMIPSRRTNAGFGWILSLGRLLDRNAGGCQGGELPLSQSFIGYESPDGAAHCFYGALHSGTPVPAPSDPSVYYTRDGSYLRADFRNGGRKLEFPNGEIREFDALGRLTAIRDRFDNSVTVAYDDTTKEWHIHDSTGRDHYVRFIPAASYQETLFSQEVSHLAVSEVDLATVGGARLVYKLHYENEGTTWSSLQRVGDTWMRRPPGYVDTTRASLLTSISVESAGASLTPPLISVPSYAPRTMWSFDYNRSGQPSGTLSYVKYPTGGRVDYAYEEYRYPPAAPAPTQKNPNVGTFSWSAGLVRRKLFNAAGTLLGERVIEHDDGLANAYVEFSTRTVTEIDAKQGTLSKTRHYFSQCRFRCAANSATGEFGLPLARTAGSSGGMYLSTESFGPDPNLTDRPWTLVLRRQYLKYEADHDIMIVPDERTDENRRVVAQRTQYVDANVTADSTNSDFDGLGNYRTNVTAGTFGVADVRTTKTRFNPVVTAAFLPATTLTAHPGGYTPPLDKPWILNTYSFRTVETSDKRPDQATATSHSSVKFFCFDSTTGFLRLARSLVRSPNTDAATTLQEDADLLTVSAPDAHGNVVKEQYVGGDYGLAAPAIPVTTAAGTCDSVTLSSDAYQLQHDYTGGALIKSRHVGAGTDTVTHYDVDQDVDPSTGVVTASRSLSIVGAASTGMTVNYAYDALTRITGVRPQSGGGAWLSYSYQDIVTSSSPVMVTAYALGNGQTTPSSSALSHEEYEYDAFGRLTTERRETSVGAQANATVYRRTEYNHLGQTTSKSEWENTASPTHKTTFGYDPFGRPTSVLAPDKSELVQTYIGVGSTSRKVRVATNPALALKDQPQQETIEQYDRQGRLWRITEPDGVKTEYTYDGSSRLWQVCQNIDTNGNCGQRREFVYDNRGFLISETHPENGTTGNGTTNYGLFDARGHAGSRRDGPVLGAFDIRFTYDRAERLRKVESASGRLLKMFDFGVDNSGSDYRNGRLLSATRINWFLASNQAVKVRETYVYAGIGARPSQRTTDLFDCTIGGAETCNSAPSGTPTRSFSHALSYDDVGSVITLNYPTCTFGCGTLPSPPQVTNTYTKGLLTQVSFTANSATSNNAITYWPNGLVYQVQHSNGVTDTQLEDTNGMARPGGYQTTGAADTTSCTPPSIRTQPLSQSMSAGQVVTLAVDVDADSNLSLHPLTFKWYADGTLLSNETGNNLTLTQPPAQTTVYWMVASNGCAPDAETAHVTVTVCASPSISYITPSHSITRGQTYSLSVTPENASTSNPFSYQWYVAGSALPNGAVPYVQVSPSVTTTYYVVVSNACGSVQSQNVTVTVYEPPTAPLLTAQFATGGLSVTWTASVAEAGLRENTYLVQRSVEGSRFDDYGLVFQENVRSFTDSNVVGGKTYIYRVRAFDSNSVASAWSSSEMATTITFTDTTLAGKALRGVHFGELRQAIDSVRRSAGIPTIWSSYASPTGPVTLNEMLLMRNSLAEARIRIGAGPLVVTHNIVPGTRIHAADLEDLRTGVK
jgi:YD repeat-containing protein